QQVAASIFQGNKRILEVGCGTGTEALFFARQGHHVSAIDPSLEMLAVAREKIVRAGFAEVVEFLQGSAECMESLIEKYGAESFDGIFSNFGALNCVADLRRFAEGVNLLLRPAGKILLSIMPPICPWEIGYHLLHLQPAEAFRRWRGRTGARGIPVLLGNRKIQARFHSRADVITAFSPLFDLEKQFAFGLFVPPPYLHAMARHQKLFGVMLRCEGLMVEWPLLRNWGDHLVMILGKRASAERF
ncbi:MAG: class I SAM-dependent methyltransferase, partial [candidate division KSB1 bacterium]|nr:class I SAM-dependent methyltransferase [candidate division KSB1 bacterium]